MRKKLDTRFPASRIKKIMQADEDVGKIAMAVPLLVSKALELFLQDLCDRTYEVTLKKGAKTVNSLHLKQCVQSFNVFDFLKDTVSKVPDLGGSDASAEDRSATKRRKISEDDECGNDDEFKRLHMHETGCPGHTASSGRTRGSRGRGRGRGRGCRALERESTVVCEKLEDSADVFPNNDENPEEHTETPDNVLASAVRNFDLNVDLNEVADSTLTLAAAPEPLAKEASGTKHEGIPSWHLDEVEGMPVDSIQFANFNGRLGEEEEDYDEVE